MHLLLHATAADWHINSQHHVSLGDRVVNGPVCQQALPVIPTLVLLQGQWALGGRIAHRLMSPQPARTHSDGPCVCADTSTLGSSAHQC